MPTTTAATHGNGIALLLGGAVAMLIGAMGSTTFIADRRDRSPTRRMLASTAPIAVSVLMAWFAGHPEVSIGIIFGTSVAMLCTVVGSICSVAPVGPAPGRWRRLWGFTVAASLVTFIAGFAGTVNWMGAVVLAAEGMVIFWLWADTSADYRDPLEDAPLFKTENLANHLPAWQAWAVGVTGVIFAGVGAAFATRGAASFSALRGNVPTGTLAASLFSMALVTPSMHSARRLGLAGLSWVPMTAQSGVVIFNLCVLLPVLALLPYAAAHLPVVTHWFPPMFDWREKSVELLAFPLAVWRVDAILLLIISILYLPVSMGRWNLGRGEGMLLVIAYFGYLIATTVSGVRP